MLTLRTTASICVAMVGLHSFASLGAEENVTPESVATHYADIVLASYEDSLSTAKALTAQVKAFTDAPSNETLSAAKVAWLTAREPYGQTEAYRFYDGPIDDAEGPEGLLNAWPLDEHYIDATIDFPKGGIVQDSKTYPALTADALRELNEKDGDANIATGYHAVEFLLWGQDLNEVPYTAGNRPFTDYTTAANADRRKAYVVLACEMIVSDLESLVAEWQVGGAYRKAFLANPEEAVGKAITGIGSLAGGELAGERMAVALANKDQEDEHSCFSDNTHRDIVTNAIGIHNVYFGQYARINGEVLSGPSIHDLIAAKDPALAAKASAALAESVARASLIQAPFDQEISGTESAPGRQRVQATIGALWAFTKIMPDTAKVIGIEVAIDGAE